MAETSVIEKLVGPTPPEKSVMDRIKRSRNRQGIRPRSGERLWSLREAITTPL